MSFNRKELKVISSAKKKQNPFSKDILYTPRGQYDFPYQPTRVPGSNMTTAGVPYPMVGIGSTGQQQIMYPGGEYSFPGSTYVDELPIFQTRGEVQPEWIVDPLYDQAATDYFFDTTVQRRIDYLNSPQALEIMKKAVKESYPHYDDSIVGIEAKKWLRTKLNEIQNNLPAPYFVDGWETTEFDGTDDTLGLHHPDKGMFLKRQGPMFEHTVLPTVMAHELVHHEDYMGLNVTKAEHERMMKNILSEEEYINRLTKNDGTLTVDPETYQRHKKYYDYLTGADKRHNVSKSGEIHGRLGAIKEGLQEAGIDIGNKKITKEDIDKWRKTNTRKDALSQWNELKELYGGNEEEIINLLNTVVYEEPAMQDGLVRAKYGGSKLKKYQGTEGASEFQWDRGQYDQYSYQLLNQIRQKYQHLDPETQKWKDEYMFGDDKKAISFGGKKPIKRYDDYSNSRVVGVGTNPDTGEYTSWKVAGHDFKPNLTNIEETGIGSGADRVIMTYRDHPQYGMMPVYVGTGPKSQKFLYDKKGFGDYASFKSLSKAGADQLVPGYTLPEDIKRQEGYHTYRQSLMDQVSPTVAIKKRGGKTYQGDEGSSQVSEDKAFDAWSKAYESQKTAEAAKLAEEKRIAGLYPKLEQTINKIAESENPAAFLVDKGYDPDDNYCNAYTNTCYNLSGYTTAEDILMKNYYAKGKDRFIAEGSPMPQIPGNLSQMPFLDEEGFYEVPVSEAQPGDLFKRQTWAKALPHQISDDVSEEKMQGYLSRKPGWKSGHSKIFMGYDDEGRPIFAQSHGEYQNFEIESMDPEYHKIRNYSGKPLAIAEDMLLNYDDPNNIRYRAYRYKGDLPTLEQDVEKYSQAEKMASEVLDKMMLTHRAPLKPAKPLPIPTNYLNPTVDTPKTRAAALEALEAFQNRAYKQGGSYTDLELTDEQIKQYKEGGFVIEELPEYQTQGQVNFQGNDLMINPWARQQPNYLLNSIQSQRQQPVTTAVDDEIKSKGGWEYKKEGDKYLTRESGTQDWIEATGKPLAHIKYKIYGEGEDPETPAEKEAAQIETMRNLFRDDEAFWSKDIDDLSPKMQRIHQYAVDLKRGEEHDPNSKEGKEFETYAKYIASPEGWMKIMPETMGKIFDASNDPNKFKSIKKTWGENTAAQIETGQARTKNFGTPDQNIINFANEQKQNEDDYWAYINDRYQQSLTNQQAEAAYERDMLKYTTGVDRMGNRVPDWQMLGYRNADDYYAKLQWEKENDPFEHLFIGPKILAELTGIPSAARLLGETGVFGEDYEGASDWTDYLGVIPGIGLLGKAAKAPKLLRSIPAIARTADMATDVGRTTWNLGKKGYGYIDKAMDWNPTKTFTSAPSMSKYASLNNLAAGYSAYHMPEAIENVAEDPTDWRNWLDVGLTTLGASPVAAGSINLARKAPSYYRNVWQPGWQNVRAGYAKPIDLFKTENYLRFSNEADQLEFARRASSAPGTAPLSEVSNKWYNPTSNPTAFDYTDDLVHMLPASGASQAHRKVANLTGDVGQKARGYSVKPSTEVPDEWFTTHMPGASADEIADFKAVMDNRTGYWNDPRFKSNPTYEDLSDKWPVDPYEIVAETAPSLTDFVPTSTINFGRGSNQSNLFKPYTEGFRWMENTLHNAPGFAGTALLRPTYLGERVHSLEQGMFGSSDTKEGLDRQEVLDYRKRAKWNADDFKDLGVYRFQGGGTVMELDDDEIKAYQDGGFTVEEVPETPEVNLHLPKMGYQPRNVNPFMFADTFPIGQDMNALLVGAGVNAMFDTPLKGLRAGVDLTATNMTGFQDGKMIFNEPRINLPSIKLHYTLPNKKR